MPPNPQLRADLDALRREHEGLAALVESLIAVMAGDWDEYSYKQDWATFVREC